MNNAGVWSSARSENRDGIERTLATNVLGPHLLVHVLAARLGSGARVVNVVSGLTGSYDADDLGFVRRRYDGFKVYAQSKQALRMLTWGQAARLRDRGVTVNAAAPGFVRTSFNQNNHGLVATLIDVSARLFGTTPEKGADTPLWVATAPELAGRTGLYFEARREREGGFRDPAAIAELEQRLDALLDRVPVRVQGGAGTSAVV